MERKYWYYYLDRLRNLLSFSQWSDKIDPGSRSGEVAARPELDPAYGRVAVSIYLTTSSRPPPGGTSSRWAESGTWFIRSPMPRDHWWGQGYAEHGMCWASPLCSAHLLHQRPLNFCITASARPVRNGISAPGTHGDRLTRKRPTVFHAEPNHRPSSPMK